MEETPEGGGASSSGADGPECMAAVRATEVSRQERPSKGSLLGLLYIIAGVGVFAACVSSLRTQKRRFCATATGTRSPHF